MANQKPQFDYEDQVTDFALGVNMGLDPLKLPNNQLSDAFNATVRGQFVTNRPNYNLLNLLFPTETVASGVQSALFQGACYYAPDFGQQMIVAQIGGRMFTFTPDVGDNNVQVTEVTIPGDPNSATDNQVWMEQAERWVIVQTGNPAVNPIFFDGNSGTSIRSNYTTVPNGYLLATTDGTNTFISPVLGGTMQVPLSGTYSGPLNLVVQLVEFDLNDPPNVVATTNWLMLGPFSGGVPISYQVTLQNVSDLDGQLHDPGSILGVQPNNLGDCNTTSEILESYGVLRYVTMTLPLPNYVSKNSTVTIANDQLPYVWVIQSIDTTRTKLILLLATTQTSVSHLGMSTMTLTGSHRTNQTVGILAAPFIAPEVGMNVTVTVQNIYTYGNGTYVWVNGAEYFVISSGTSGGTGLTGIVLQNLNDDRTGHVFNVPAINGPTLIYAIPQLPPGRMMAYNQGRVALSLPNGASFGVGDIVGGSTGSPAYNGRDAVLNYSENALLAGGGFFSVPANLGQISALKSIAQLDASLGQGPTMVVCPNGVFSFNAPADRTTWASLTNPIVSESLIGLGGVSQDSTVCCNGDLIFRATDGIRSLIMGRRDFWSWGNAPISFEVQNILNADNPNLLPYTSAVQFDNRMLMTCTPVQGQLGVYSTGLIALNFDPVSSLQGKAASVYDGRWNDLNILKIITGNFSGVDRCFAFVYSTISSQIQLVELLKSDGASASDNFLDNNTTPVTWGFTTAALLDKIKTKDTFNLAGLEDGAFYVADIQPDQTIGFVIEYQPGLSQQWFPWHNFSIKNESSNIVAYAGRLGLGKPVPQTGQTFNSTNTITDRWFQVRFTITGHCIFYGLEIFASKAPEPEYAQVIPKGTTAIINQGGS